MLEDKLNSYLSSNLLCPSIMKKTLSLLLAFSLLCAFRADNLPASFITLA